ncbi:MAG: ComEC/Rec2 family competence protein [Candidatus Levyibacteriota bacterium]
MKKLVLIILVTIIALVSVSVYEYFHFYDGKLHVIFCNVGQGDAILIVTPTNKHILNDGGPDQKVMDCLSRHMPFWEQRIDLMILTHPHADHFFGMFDVLRKYQVKAFATEDLLNKTQGYQELLKRLAQKQVPQVRVFAGDSWHVGQVRLQVVGPTEAYLNQTSPGGTIGESKEFASVITEVSYGSFSALLTGDSQASGLDNVLNNINTNLTVLQSPHHGSATGLNAAVLQSLAPRVAVISVGAHNRYGHPSPQILDLYKSFDIPYHRTDQEGDVEIVSDGNTWKIK